MHLPIYEILTEKLYACIPSVFCTEQDNILDYVAFIENPLFTVTKIKQKIRWWNQFPEEIHSFPVLYFIIASIILFLFWGRKKLLRLSSFNILLNQTFIFFFLR